MSAATPTPVEDIQGDGRWLSIHNRFVSQAREMEPDVLFVGDSLIANLQSTDLWEKWFVPMHSLNFGIGGDQTQNVLWRLHNGELECLKPKAVVILVGTNNHSNTAEEVAEGVMEICNTVREKQPQAYIIALTIPPRGQKHNSLREKNNKVNAMIIEGLKDKPQCQVVASDQDLLLPDGSIDHRDMYDYLHLTWQGYQKAFRPVYELLLNLLQEEDNAILNDASSPVSDNPPSSTD
ncbi:UNVERIFIED_CONTAM: hypothetical protein RMT77_001442 [Armadillidium vulgare]